MDNVKVKKKDVNKKVNGKNSFPWDTCFGAHEFDDDMGILEYFKEDQEEFKKMFKKDE